MEDILETMMVVNAFYVLDRVHYLEDSISDQPDDSASEADESEIDELPLITREEEQDEASFQSLGGMDIEIEPVDEDMKGEMDEQPLITRGEEQEIVSIQAPGAMDIKAEPVDEDVKDSGSSQQTIQRDLEDIQTLTEPVFVPVKNELDFEIVSEENIVTENFGDNFENMDRSENATMGCNNDDEELMDPLFIPIKAELDFERISEETTMEEILEVNESSQISLVSPQNAQITPPKRKKMMLKPHLKRKCGACGNVGHMQTNKSCPLYQDRTKAKLSRNLSKRTRKWTREFLKERQRPANRKRADPVVVLSTILETVLNDMRDMPDVEPFLLPVKARAVPDYHKIVARPMDLQTIRVKLWEKKYRSREDFLADVNQIVENSALYNGAHSSLTLAAKQMLNICRDRLWAKEERLSSLEKAINPLLSNNPQVALAFILDKVLNRLNGVSESWYFHKAANKQLAKDYYNTVKEPMDLETVAKKVTAHKYHHRDEFMADIQRILDNCILDNGEDSAISQKAEVIVTVCHSVLEEYGECLTRLENNISQVDSYGTWRGVGEENCTVTETFIPASEYELAIMDHSYTRTNSSPDYPFGRTPFTGFEFVDVEAL